MKLSWSHAVLYVRDLDLMLNFYSETLGFTITDRGPIGSEDSPEIVFMSQSPTEHHQIAMVASRKDDQPSNSVNHFAFRVETFEVVTGLNRSLASINGIKVMPLSHGNTLSIYFNDPEGNGIEVFWDTPWHVAQPQGQPWDPAMDKQAALDWVSETFGQEETFVAREDYYRHKHAGLVN